MASPASRLEPSLTLTYPRLPPSSNSLPGGELVCAVEAVLCQVLARLHPHEGRVHLIALLHVLGLDS